MNGTPGRKWAPTDARRPDLAGESERIDACVKAATSWGVGYSEGINEIGIFLGNELYSEYLDVCIAALSKFIAPGSTLVPAPMKRELLTAAYGEVSTSTWSTNSVPQAAAYITSQGGDGEGLMEALIRFESRKHLGLIWKVANRMSTNLSGSMTVSDLTGYGWRGLVKALKTYNPHTAQFSTFAAYKIKGEIRDGVRAESEIPKRLTTTLNTYNRACESLTQILGRVPTMEEVAERMGEHAAQLHLIPRLETAASLEELTSNDESNLGELTSLLEGKDPSDIALESYQSERVKCALGQLDSIDADIIRMSYLEERPISEIRAATGLDARKIALRQKKALSLLGELLADWAPTYA